MKGTFFQKPLELSIRVEGESWNQGEDLQGVLEVKNHGSEPVSVADAQVHLARGELKKVRAKSPEAFDILASSAGVLEAPLAPGQSASLSWSFPIERNFPITDNLTSPFLVYGVGQATEKMGQLQLSVQPAAPIQEFLDRLQVNYRFVQKSRRYTAKNLVEIKLDPPDAKAFSSLELLVLSFRFDVEALEVHYQFQVKKLEATAANVETKKEKREFEQRYERHEYMLPSGRFNQERLEAGIREALGAVEPKFLG